MIADVRMVRTMKEKNPCLTETVYDFNIQLKEYHITTTCERLTKVESSPRIRPAYIQILTGKTQITLLLQEMLFSLCIELQI